MLTNAKKQLEQKFSKKLVLMHKNMKHALHCEALSVYMMMSNTDLRFTLSHLKFVLKYVQFLQCHVK